jgi:hypothetical protein
MGWVEEAGSILNECLRKFPGGEDIQDMLEKIEDETDDPGKGKKPPMLTGKHPFDVLRDK